MPKTLALVLTLTLALFGCDSGDGGAVNTQDTPEAGSSLDTGGGGGGGGGGTTDGGPIDDSATGTVTLDGTIKSLQQTAEAAGCDEDAQYPVTVDESVTVNSAVVTSPRFEVSDNLDGYYVCDGDQAEWSGIMMTIPTSENSNFQPGDVLTLSGELEEAWCNTQLGIEAGGWELTGTADVPQPLAIAA
ncbi:MAG: hypothetical protein QF464_19540, partial [Myxococcota bacterium]|nr:hypothetical protein [Myxococcota bacterium]